MTTLVTCYYEFKSKHSTENYRIWIKNLLNNISCNIIIFTSNDLVKFLKESYKHKNIFFIVKPLKELTIFLKYKDIWAEQYRIDPNKKCGRTIGCYVLWNSKFQFLKEAIDINPFNSDKFVWNDIGSMRNKSCINLLKKYPNYDKINNNKLDIIMLNSYKNLYQTFFHEEVHISGAIFGGHKDVILKLHKKYYDMFEFYIKNNKFIG